MKKERVAILGLLLLLGLSTFSIAQATNTKPHRTVKLPRYMTDMQQPIPDELKLSNAPNTSRDVACFRSFDGRTSMMDVVRKCGIPDEHQGSGIAIFIYNMSDGSVVAVGTPDLKRLFYVDHVSKHGGGHLLKTDKVHSQK